MNADATRAARLTAQLLRGAPVGTVADVARRLVGVAAQDVRANRLAVRVRLPGSTAAGVEAAVAAGSVVRTWAMRGTLHLLAAEDAGWVVSLLGPRFVARMAGRRRQLGLDDRACARGVAALRDVLAGGGLTRPEVVARLVTHGVELEPRSQAPAHLLAYAALTGTIRRGPETPDDEPTYVLGPGEPSDADPAQLQARLALRYLAGHAPASAADLAAWSGLPLGVARAGFAAIADRLRPVDTPGGPAHVLDHVPDPASPAPRGSVRLLGHFDPYLLGYRSRSLAVPDSFAGRIQAGGGFVMPAVLVDGVAVGTWRQQHRARHSEVLVEPFGALPEDTPAGIEAEAADLGRFLGRAVTAGVTTTGGPR